jgi:hypothetical protein
MPIQASTLFTTALMLIVAFALTLPANINAEEPEQPPEIPGINWIVRGEGTYFEITANVFMDVTLVMFPPSKPWTRIYTVAN